MAKITIIPVVIPQRGSSPGRAYQLRKNRILVCCECEPDNGVECGVIMGKELWHINLPTKALAIAVMDDLYYGEYTGG